MFDLTSEVTGRHRTIKLDTIGFLSLRATRSSFREALGSSGAEWLGGGVQRTPYELDAVKSRTRARVKTHTTHRKKMTPDIWVIHSVKSVLLSRVFLLKKNGYFYLDRVPLPKYSGFNNTVILLLYSLFLVRSTPLLGVYTLLV